MGWRRAAGAFVEGSLKGGDEKVGAMEKERWEVVAEINEVRCPVTPCRLLN